MTTALDQIKGALRLCSMLGEDEEPADAVSNDCLVAMNQMLDSWSTERLSVYATQDQVLTWPANTISRTLGPTGTLVGNRPVSVDDSTYFVDTDSGVSYGVNIINQQQYDGIALKTATSTYPQVIFVNYDMPNITMYLYPVPTKALQFHFISVTELAQPATLATVLSFPPGYMRAFKYCLACEIAAEFGIEPPPTVQRIAMASKRNLKSQNAPMDVMSMPHAMMGTKQRFNVFSGNF